jgi:enoyl-CoA hydratase
MSGTVRVERRATTSLWILDNPRKRNALDRAMLEALANAAAEVEREREVRSVVIVGEGDRGFCSGADISAWGALDPVDFGRSWVGGGHAVFDRLARLPVPFIGAINGSTFGGGLELAAICDVRVAAKNALFGLPEASIGVTPGWSGAQRLGRLLPQALLREMALTGGLLTAERLLTVGFLNEIVEEPRPVRSRSPGGSPAWLRVRWRQRGSFSTPLSARAANRRSTGWPVDSSRQRPTRRRASGAFAKSGRRTSKASSGWQF